MITKKLFSLSDAVMYRPSNQSPPPVINSQYITIKKNNKDKQVLIVGAVKAWKNTHVVDYREGPIVKSAIWNGKNWVNWETE